MSLENFDCLGLLGRGCFAKVFQVRKKNGDDANNIYALKTIVFTDLDTQIIANEKNILSRVQHTFVVQLIDSFEIQNTFYFVLEYVSGGTLEDLLHRTGKLEHDAVSFYMKEMVVGLEYLHSQGIIHGDIKPSNILLDATGHIKITDFGISIDLFPDSKYRFQVYFDWNALGAVFYNMLTGTILVHKDQWPKTLSKKVRDLLQKLLKTNSKSSLEYIEAKNIKKCKFFKQTCWEKVSLRLEEPPFIPPTSTECCFSNADLCNNYSL